MEYIKLSYHHLNFEDRTALMLESRKEGFSARKFAELIKRHPSTIYRERLCCTNLSVKGFSAI